MRMTTLCLAGRPGKTNVEGVEFGFPKQADRSRRVRSSYRWLRSRMVVQTRVASSVSTTSMGMPSDSISARICTSGGPPADGEREAFSAEVMDTNSGIEDFARGAPMGLGGAVDFAVTEGFEDEDLLPGGSEASGRESWSGCQAVRVSGCQGSDVEPLQEVRRRTSFQGSGGQGSRSSGLLRVSRYFRSLQGSGDQGHFRVSQRRREVVESNRNRSASPKLNAAERTWSYSVIESPPGSRLTPRRRALLGCRSCCCRGNWRRGRGFCRRRC